MPKISKHPYYTDPTAFSKQFPRIERITVGTALATVMKGVIETAYKMGPIRVGIVEPTPERPLYFMSIHGRDRYPTWDEMVWLRYNLIPDAALMTMLLPNINGYINRDGEHHQFVFTFEQRGWALDPIPQCEQCQTQLRDLDVTGDVVTMGCPQCHAQQLIHMSSWNEDHGNGLLAKRG